MKALLKQTIPAPCRRRLRLALRRVQHLGWRRFCPLCRAHIRTFGADSRTERPGAVCPVCDSMERHRLIWPFLMRETLLGRAELRVLHVAPEFCFERLIQRMPRVDYVTLDLEREDVRVRGDLTKLDFADGEFDLIICNHVLEHIPDDRAAMHEMYRVLSSGGQAVITVPGPDPSRGGPAVLGETLEGAPDMGPAERLRAYGHPGHVRLYGLDLADRLGSCGFDVRRIEYGREWTDADKARCGVGSHYPIYFCEKTAR